MAFAPRSRPAAAAPVRALRRRLAALVDRPALRRWLAAPVAPLLGAWLAYRLHHPPRQEPRRTPADYGLTPMELRICAGPRKRCLHAWLFAADPQRVVVLGHSIGADKSRSLPYARFLARAGYTVVLFDFRNHGRSFPDRHLTGFSNRFGADLVRVVEHIRAMPPYGAARIALYGVSMSSFAGLHVLDRLAPVDAMICDSGPALDPSLTVRNLLRTGLMPLPTAMAAPPAFNLLEAAFRPLATASMRPPRNWPPAPGQPGCDSTAMLFIVGDRDRVVSADEVRVLAKAYRRARVAVVPGADHLRTMAADRDAYQAMVLDFLAQWLGKANAEALCG